MQITLHITKNEIYDWMKVQAGKNDLYFAIVKDPPDFKVLPLPSWEQFKEFDHIHNPGEIWIDTVPFECKNLSQLDCLRNHQERLSFRLPQMTENGLHEGCLSTLCSDDNKLKKWKSIIGFFRRNTKAGMWALSPHSNAKCFSSHNRYSKGIEELHHNGLKLLPIAGWSLLFINEPT